MEFKEKEYDGPYEVARVEINNQNQIMRGILYFPPKNFKKPYPLIIYFHGFLQLFSLEEIVKNYQYLLDSGYAFLSFNFRGYKFSEGEISIKSHVSDSYKLMDFVEKMAKQDIFTLKDINIISYDFGSYITLLLCSKVKFINKILLISPILDLERHIYDIEFKKALDYINRYLPGYVRGIENIDAFIQMTKKELSKKEFHLQKAISRLNNEKLKVISGDHDKITPLSEVKMFLNKSNLKPELIIIDSMDHESIFDDEIEEIKKEIEKFFIK